MHINLRHRPCVLAIDIGTSSVRTILFDQMGQMASSAFQNIYKMETSSDGGVYIDADRLVEEVGSVLDKFCSVGGHPPIDGVAMTTFWHNVVGVEGDHAITPLISWADTRPGTIIGELREQLDTSALHKRTGCVLHSSYLPAKIWWFARNDPKNFARVDRWMSIGEYLFLKWFGEPACSVSMASGTGLFNAHCCDWDNQTLSALPVDRSQLTALSNEKEAVHGLVEAYAARWPILAGAAWYPAIGDGASNNIGSGCVDKNHIALMVGTSGAMRVMQRISKFTVPDGLWCYRSDRRRILIGGALSNGGNVYNWMRSTLHLGDEKILEKELSGMQPDSHGLTVLPFWAGERSPGWHPAATAAVTGMTLHTTPLDIMRASLEATTFCFADIYNRLRSINIESGKIVASGAGLLKSPAWMQMLADVLEQPVTASAVKEASSRGAALLALEFMDALEDLSQVVAPIEKTYQPNLSNSARYREAMNRYQELYDMMMDS